MHGPKNKTKKKRVCKLHDFALHFADDTKNQNSINATVCSPQFVALCRRGWPYIGVRLYSAFCAFASSSL